MFKRKNGPTLNISSILKFVETLNNNNSNENKNNYIKNEGFNLPTIKIFNILLIMQKIA